MMDNGEKKDKEKEEDTSFTVDSEISRTVEVPSINRLLNRKTLVGFLRQNSQNTSTQGRVLSSENPPKPALPPAQPTDTTLRTPKSTTVKSQTIRSSGNTTTTTRLIVWTIDQLRSASDPIQQAISVMLQKGVQSTLFLTIHPPQAGSPLPHFIGYAAVGSPNKVGLWTGLQWNPVSVPQIWNLFVKQGFVEIPPSSTREYNHPNLVRAAYGVSPNEWLLLARAGTEQACRGIVAFVSASSMAPNLRSVLPLLATSRHRNKKT